MEKIAVIGMSCLFPGAKNPQEFFQNLLDGKDSTSDAGKEQMGVDPDLFLADKKGIADKYYSKRGGFIRGFDFDASGYELPAESLQQLDPIYQWPLYVAKQALKDSGYLGQQDLLKKCGLVLGNLSFPTRSSNDLFLPIYNKAIEASMRGKLDTTDFQLPTQEYTPHHPYANSRISGYPAKIVAEALSLFGGHFALDAACASSLYSVKLACDYLLTGKTDLMLAGAVSAADPLFVNIGFSTFQAYPEDGVTCPLDQRSGGLVAGEGAGMFVLKRYQDALRDGDSIRAVISGIGLSNDGRGRFVLSPNPKGQLLAYERAYQDSPVQPSDVSYIECHATGTPVGDSTEINSLESFFGDSNPQLKLGSVKANFGHLLTAAGMAGMMKVIAAMASETIPATIKVEQPILSKKGKVGGDNVLTRNTPWSSKASKRVAAVNAFGFGGTNAHMIFESPEITEQEKKELLQKTTNLSIPQSQPLAIVGMDAHFGSAQSLNAFEQQIYSGKQDCHELPQDRWKGIQNSKELLAQYGLDANNLPQGSYIESLEIDFLRFKIPPNQDDPLIPQQLLMLQVADNALKDARMEEGGNVAVLIAMETDTTLHQLRGRIDLTWKLKQALAEASPDLNAERYAALESTLKDSVHNPVAMNQFTSFIGNIMASRLSSLWDFTGPAFTVSSEENSFYKALELGQMMLDRGEVDSVVIGAIDLAGNLENVLLRHHLQTALSKKQSALALEADSKGWVIGEGAGAVVLKRKEQALENHDPIYATINALSLRSGSSVEAIVENSLQALKSSGVAPESVGYVEVFGSSRDEEVKKEIQALNQTYQKGEQALGCVKNNFGDTGAASGIAALIKTALLLNQRFLPGVDQWQAPKHPELWSRGQFYVPTASKTWYPTQVNAIRYAAINSMGTDGSLVHCILAEETQARKNNSSFLQKAPAYLFPVSGDTQADLLGGLTALRQALQQSQDLQQIANSHYQLFLKTGKQAYTLVILAQEPAILEKEIEAAMAGIPQAIRQKTNWTTPHGSYFTSKPLGKEGKISFVYPGGFNSYLGMNRDLMQAFPELHNQAKEISSYPQRMFRDGQVFPRSLYRLSAADQKLLQTEMVEDAIGMFETGITTTALYTHLIRETFGIRPDSAFGYSMGEVSMMYALGCWGKTDRMSDILHNKSIFRNRLAGPMNTVRDAWNLPKAKVGDRETIWECYSIPAPVETVQKLVDQEARAFLIIINHPTEVVIAGAPEACAKIVGQLDVQAIKVPMSDVIHCDLVQADYERIVELHHSPIQSVPAVDFYTSMNYQKTEVTSEQIAHNIAQLYCQQMDFPRLIRKVYEDGARIFLELGPRGSCSKAIKETLKGQDHVAIGVNRKGLDDHTALLQALAQLMSHQVSLDLSALYPAETKEMKKKTFIQSIKLGGHNIYQTIQAQLDGREFSGLSFAKPQGASNFKGAPAVQSVVPPAVQSSLTAAEKDESYRFQMEQMNQHRSLVSQSHGAFLEVRHASIQQLRETISLQMDLSGISPTGVGSTPFQELAKTTAPPANKQVLVETTVPQTNKPPLVKTTVPQANKLPLVKTTVPPTDNRQPPTDNRKPVTAQFTEQHIHEFALGSIAKCFGSEFDIYAGRRSQRNPNGDLQLITRVLAATGERKDFKKVSSMIGEYDVPADAWFYEQNSYAVMPYSVIMEIALQPCGFLGAYMGSPLIYPEADLGFRNLSAKAKLLKNPDLRGKTITTKARLLMTSYSSETVVQKYKFELLHEGEIFYQGETVFGYFTPEAFAKQLGLDKGKKIPAWVDDAVAPGTEVISLNLRATEVREKYYQSIPAKPFYHLGVNQLDFIEQVRIVEKGGKYQQGYIYAEKAVDAKDWFFPCHFHEDPVMPGSLGVEAILQSMRVFALHQDLGKDLRSPHFDHVLDQTQWKYSGQIVPENEKMSLEVHIKSIERHQNKIIVKGDANLWKDDLRIYELKDTAIAIVES